MFVCRPAHRRVVDVDVRARAKDQPHLVLERFRAQVQAQARLGPARGPQQRGSRREGRAFRLYCRVLYEPAREEPLAALKLRPVKAS